MRANQEFLGLPGNFWAHVRSLSQTIGYTARGEGTIKVPTVRDVFGAMRALTLQTDHLVDGSGQLTVDGEKLLRYFAYRADVLNSVVQHQLQTKPQAEAMYGRLKAQIPSQRAPSMNKQKGEKANVAYLTEMVNLLIEANAGGIAFDSNPMQLTTFTHEGRPVRTLARRVDGAFPSAVNPVAIWEIKEYYNTTTFGSRVADGVYETLLDGMELQEMRIAAGIDVRHVLIVDAHYTWWECGRAYLCRMIDMLHMGLVSEILFGREIEDRLPVLVAEWRELLSYRAQQGADRPRPHGQTPLI